MSKITLANLATATSQQVFDQTAVHLLTQGVKSFDEENHECRYRGPENRMCAAGCLMTDEEYAALQTDGAVEGTIWGGVVDGHSLTHQHEDLIRDLQKVHDNCNEEDWKENLIALAAHHNLNTQAIDHLELNPKP